MTIIHGTLALLGTAFGANGKVNADAYCQEIDWCLENGATGIITAPSVGEFTVLSREERLSLFQIGVDQARQHGPQVLTMAMVSSPSTEEAVTFGLEAKAMGYASILMVPPWYWHCTESEVYKHYATVAEKVGLPLCIYNNPPLTGFSMTPDFIHRLLQIPGIEATKETVVDLTHLHHLFKLLGDEPPVLPVHRSYLYCLMNGCTSSTMAPFSLRAAVALKKAFQTGNWHRATALQQAMATLLPPMGEGGAGLVGMWKFASSAAMGIDLGVPRAPHGYPDEKIRRVIVERLEALQRLAREAG